MEPVKPYDMRCPLMVTPGNPDGLNYWKENCEYRQKHGHKICLGGCKVSKERTKHKPSQQDAVSYGKEWTRMSLSGMTMVQIAEQVGYSPSTVHRYMQMANGGSIEFEGKKDYSHLGEEWYGLRQQGVSTRDIANKYGVGMTTVNKWIRQAKTKGKRK